MKTFLDGFAIGTCIILVLFILVSIFSTMGVPKGVAFFVAVAACYFSVVRVVDLIWKKTKE